MQVGMFEADIIFLHSRGNNAINVWWQKNSRDYVISKGQEIAQKGKRVGER
jgi:hypothetical protein